MTGRYGMIVHVLLQIIITKEIIFMVTLHALNEVLLANQTLFC